MINILLIKDKVETFNSRNTNDANYEIRNLDFLKPGFLIEDNSYQNSQFLSTIEALQKLTQCPFDEESETVQVKELHATLHHLSEPIPEPPLSP